MRRSGPIGREQGRRIREVRLLSPGFLHHYCDASLLMSGEGREASVRTADLMRGDRSGIEALSAGRRNGGSPPLLRIRARIGSAASRTRVHRNCPKFRKSPPGNRCRVPHRRKNRVISIPAAPISGPCRTRGQSLRDPGEKRAPGILAASGLPLPPACIQAHFGLGCTEGRRMRTGDGLHEMGDAIVDGSRTGSVL